MPIKFDIVYLDFCGPLMVKESKNKSIISLLRLIKEHVVSSPGVLITNFTLPSQEQDELGRDNLAKLATLYLYPKGFITNNICISEEGLDVNQFYNKVKKNLEFYYGEFISRFIMDLCGVIVPYSKLASNKGYFKMFFEMSEEDRKTALQSLEQYDDSEENMSNDDDYDCGGWLSSDTELFSIPWTFSIIKDNSNINNLSDGDLVNIFSESFIKFAKSFLNQVVDGNNELINNIELIYYLIFAERSNYFSEKLKKIYNLNYSEIAPQFCDVFTFQSIIGVLIGQITVPYHINVKETKRWTYKAKSTRMFTDMFVLDECRYIYDMMPTIDMISNSICDIDYQLCYRFALEGLNKNQFLYNNEFFFGNAVIGRDNKGFENAEFEQRNYI